MNQLSKSDTRELYFEQNYTIDQDRELCCYWQGLFFCREGNGTRFVDRSAWRLLFRCRLGLGRSVHVPGPGVFIAFISA